MEAKRGKNRFTDYGAKGEMHAPHKTARVRLSGPADRRGRGLGW